MKKLVSVILMLAMLMSLAAVPAMAEGTTFGLTPLAQPATLRIGFFSGSAHSIPWYIADQMGFFKELNISVEYESFVNGPAMMEANASWDVCDVGGPGALNGMKNYGMYMIGEIDNEGNTAIFARPDSPIAKDPKNPEVWKGAVCILPLGTTLQHTLLSYLISIGLTGADVQMTNMDVTSGLNAFKNGQGDVLCVWNAIAYNAEDSGFIRVSDAAQMGLNVTSTMCVTPSALAEKRELVKTAWMVYYLTWDWCKQSEENMQKAIELYVESCEDEGVVADESICERALSIFACPTPAEAVDLMTTLEKDRAADGQVSRATNDLFETLDFFISVGNYAAADRANVLDNGLVNGEIATECAETLKTLGYIK